MTSYINPEASYLDGSYSQGADNQALENLIVNKVKEFVASVRSPRAQPTAQPRGARLTEQEWLLLGQSNLLTREEGPKRRADLPLWTRIAAFFGR